MMKPFALLLLVSLSVAAEGPKEDRAKAELKQVQGTWQAASLEEGGKKATASVVQQMKLTIKGEVCTFFAGDTILMRGVVKLDPGAKPKALDFASTAGRLKGQTVKCIYELESGVLKICLGSPGGSRPTEFKSGKDQPLVTYQRAKR